MADSSVILETEVTTKEKDDMACRLAGRINGLYYYYIEASLFTSFPKHTVDTGKVNLPDNTSILGTTDAICNVAYVPFMAVSKNDIYKVPYDVKRFGDIKPPTDEEGAVNIVPYVFRLKPKNNLGGMIVSETDLYPPTIRKPSLGQVRNWKYEGRLYNYPYRSIIFTSNIFDAIEVIPHLTGYQMHHDNRVKLTVQTAINPGGNFYAYVENYKGDGSDTMERSYSNISVDIPNTSSAYSNYMSTQKARTAAGTGTALLAGAAGIVGGIATGNALGIAAGIASVGTAITNNLALKQDLRTTPNSLKSMGGDINCKLGKADYAFVTAYEKTIHDDYKQMLGDFFAMYGYKQAKVMKLSTILRTRYYYNYIKTLGCNLRGKNGVPKKNLAAMKAVFDKGVTLWHVDRSNTMCNYQYDNTEMKFTFN